ncbi:MAG TPA: hypothetical protein VIG71_02320 [Enteractinococcus sp.]
MRFPQYAKTTHDEVLHAIQENNATYDEFVKHVRGFAEEFTGDVDCAVAYGWKLRCVRLEGLRTSKFVNDSTWTKPDRGGVTRPKKSNPLYERFSCLRHVAPTIPGRNDGRNQDNLIMGSGYWGVGALFILNGVAYSGFGFMPTSEVKDATEFGWQEIMPSEYEDAVEAYKEQAA